MRFLGDHVESGCRNLDPVAEGFGEGVDPGRSPSNRLTRQVADAIAVSLDGAHKGDVEFTTRVHERDADVPLLAVAFAVDFADYTVSKAVLVRCAAPGPDSAPGWVDPTGLTGDVDAMLGATADSFVFVGPSDGAVRVVPAAAVSALSGPDGVPGSFLSSVYSKSLGRFFEEFLECFIGDWGVPPDVSVDVPPDLPWDVPVSRTLVVEATETDEYAPESTEEGEATTLDDFL